MLHQSQLTTLANYEKICVHIIVRVQIVVWQTQLLQERSWKRKNQGPSPF